MKPLACVMEFYCSLCSMKFPTGFGLQCACVCLYWMCVCLCLYEACELYVSPFKLAEV